MSFDHSAYPAPKSSAEPLWHNKCGSRIHYEPFGNKFCCEDQACGGSWQANWLNTLSADELAARFHTRPDAIDNNEVLVEIDSGNGTCHLGCVPQSEAHKYRRPKF